MNTLLGIAGSLGGVSLGAFLNSRSAAKQRQADKRKQLAALAKDVLSAAAELKIALAVGHQRWTTWSARKPALAGAFAAMGTATGSLAVRAAHALAYVVENWALPSDEAGQRVLNINGRLMDALAAIGIAGSEDLRLAAADLVDPVSELMQAAGQRGKGWDTAVKAFDSALAKFHSTANKTLNNPKKDSIHSHRRRDR